VRPDVTTFGKVIGGGLPVGAYGGKREIMEQLSPEGPIYQAGTLSGNPLAMAAGLAVLHRIVDDAGIYDHLETTARRLAEGTARNVSELGLDLYSTHVGSMGTLFFTNRRVTNYSDAKTCDTEMYGRYFHEMLKRGVYLAPSQFEASFISSRHAEDQIDQTLEAQREALTTIEESITTKSG
jgi:glutamate-1-semialdehyde 2,1-aminomutase